MTCETNRHYLSILVLGQQHQSEGPPEAIVVERRQEHSALAFACTSDPWRDFFLFFPNRTECIYIDVHIRICITLSPTPRQR
jgi:hypothetical protein